MVRWQKQVLIHTRLSRAYLASFLLLLFSRRISLTRTNMSIFTRDVTGFHFALLAKCLQW